MSKTDLGENFLKGTVATAIGRGAKRLAVSAGRELGMKSMDAVKDGQNARDKITDDFLGFAKQQGWPKSSYTTGTLLAFISQRYNWMPDDPTMLKIAEFAKANWGKSTLEKVTRENHEFISSANILLEASTAASRKAEAQAQADYRLLMRLKKEGHLETVVRAYKGEKLDSPTVRGLGGVEVLTAALDALHRSADSPGGDAPQAAAQAAPAAAPEAAAAPAGDGGGGGHANPPSDSVGDDGGEENPISGSFSGTPTEHRAKWQRLQSILPGRDKVLTRGQMDEIATIIGRDMLRRGLMAPMGNDEADGSPGSIKDKRNPAIDSVAPGTGSLVSIPHFVRYLTEGGVSIVSIKELELIGANNHIDEVVKAAMDNPNIGKERLYIIAAAFSMAFRLKKEAKKDGDLSYDTHNRYISCRHMVDLLKQRNVSSGVMTQFNDIGDASNNIRDVANSLRTALGDERLREILTCFIMSIRFLSDQEKARAMKDTEAA